MKLILKGLFFIFFILFPYLSNWYFYEDHSDYDKVIKINTYHEKLSYYEKWLRIWQMDISTWDYENQTPTGRFKVMTKHERMYSKSAWKWMPYWMEFYDWVYWIHWIPETYSWKKTSIEDNVIWNSAAWWCVRLWEENIQKLYQWADYDTVVLISYDKDENFLEENIDKETWKETLEKYLGYIKDKKYIDAYSLETKHKYKFKSFKKLHTLIDIDYKNINKINNILYEVDIYIYYKWEEIISWKTIKFKILDWKIIKSYYL